jgi:hypothetical protein
MNFYGKKICIKNCRRCCCRKIGVVRKNCGDKIFGIFFQIFINSTFPLIPALSHYFPIALSVDIVLSADLSQHCSCL